MILILSNATFPVGSTLVEFLILMCYAMLPIPEADKMACWRCIFQAHERIWRIMSTPEKFPFHPLPRSLEMEHDLEHDERSY